MERKVAVIKKSIQLAENLKSQLTKEILEIEGFSSAKIRHLLNNINYYLAQDIENFKVNYLEIGTYHGSTFISALFNNNINLAVGIDNYSQFAGSQKKLESNLNEHIKDLMLSGKILILNQNFEDVFSKKILGDKKFNVYFYDGRHGKGDQFNAFAFVNDNLDDQFIAIVDDWNEERVKIGTRLAFNKLDYNIIEEFHLKSDYNGDEENWWNGLYIALISKN
ncbi:MAG: class I SAM-dependent methyltransferase [Parachlamydiales bacterium]